MIYRYIFMFYRDRHYASKSWKNHNIWEESIKINYFFKIYQKLLIYRIIILISIDEVDRTKNMKLVIKYIKYSFVSNLSEKLHLSFMLSYIFPSSALQTSSVSNYRKIPPKFHNADHMSD